MTEHRLDALIKPRKIALMGVSERDGSPGNTLARMLLDSDFAGDVYLVNPRYSQLHGQPCYPDLLALPDPVDHVVIALGNAHLEAALKAVIEHGAKAVTIYSSAVLEQDSEPPLRQRLQAMAKDAGIAVCGINGMGFYNVKADLYAGLFPRSNDLIKGGISYIAQSGSAFATLCHSKTHLGFNLCVSSGNEITTSVADYMDWSLHQKDTRVIALFLETVRDPPAFVAALKQAKARKIPVVVLKIGKSPLAASMALTHTGAIAGNHAAFKALLKRHGVIEVDDLDQMKAMLMLLQSAQTTAPGGFAAIFESGGFRELVTDRADVLGVDFASINDATQETLRQNLDPGLKAENPLDAWGSHDRFEQRFEACMQAMMQDPNVALGAFISNYRDGYYLSEAIFRAIENVSRNTEKAVILSTCYSDLNHPEISERAHQAGIPLIDGIDETLIACRRFFEYQQFNRQGQPAQAPALDPLALSGWKQKLARAHATTLTETESLALLSDFSVPVVSHSIISSEAELLSAMARYDYPVVLKTAEDGISHKSDSRGVIVNIQSQAALLDHYRDISNRLGPRALLAPMVTGVEIALGIVNDPAFGPIIMVAAGGILIEMLDDRAIALCPVDSAEATAMLDSLKVNRLLDGVRGQAASNRAALIESIVQLSALAGAFSDSIGEIDINPILVNQHEAVAVDALILSRQAETPC